MTTPSVRCPARIVLPVVLLLLTLPMAAQSKGETFNLRHVAGIRTVVSADISPDGEMVAYVLDVPREPLADDDGKAWRELHVVDRHGRTRPYVTGDVRVESVAWLPDGSAITYLSKRGEDEKKSLYTIPLRGGESRKILEFDTDIKEYSFRSDGSTFAFIACEKEEEGRKDLDDKGFNQNVYEESKKIDHIWIAGVNGDGSPPRLFPHEGHATNLVWSPKGSLIAVALAPTPHIDDRYMNRRVHIFDGESESLVARFENPGKLGGMSWSDDGVSVVFISAEDAHDPKEGRLMAAEVSGGGFVDLLPALEGHVRSAFWIDNRRILFLADEGVWTSIGEVRRDGKNRKTLVGPGGPIVNSLSLSEDGRRAALRCETPEHPAEVYFYDVARGEPVRLTNSNPWLADMRLAKQEVITYEARDGLSLEGILIHPLDAPGNERVPLILVVHGGPESHYRNGWRTGYSRPGQVAAARGMAVFYPTYRGSTGRGVPFSKLSRGDAAGKEFDDFVDGVDHLIAIGLVDSARVGITGGSYGGYASAWGATYYSDRFAASVMAVGVSNKLSKWGESDIPNELYMVHEDKLPWDDYDYLLERSPIYHAAKSHTPILILHGEKDTRVEPSQSLELYRHLKWRGRAPVRLVTYPGEGHGNSHGAARFDYSVRLLRWMTHYLQGSGGDPPEYEIDYQQELHPGETTLDKRAGEILQAD